MKKIIIAAVIISTSGIAAYSFASKSDSKKDEVIKIEKVKLVEKPMNGTMNDVSSAD